MSKGASANVGCIYCGYKHNKGREYTVKNKFGSVIHECKWVCGKCGNVIRIDRSTPKKDA